MKKLLFFVVVWLPFTAIFSQVSKQDSLSLDRSINTIFSQSSDKMKLLLQKRYYNDSIKYYHLDLPTLNSYILTEINTQRKLNGVISVTKKSDIILQKDCDEYASYLVTNNLLGHDANATYSAEIVVASTATMDGVLKNDDRAAVYTEIAKELVQSWLNSPEHRSIMLSNEYTQCIVSTSKKYYYIKNIFSSSGQVYNLRNIGFNLRGIVRFYK